MINEKMSWEQTNEGGSVGNRGEYEKKKRNKRKKNREIERETQNEIFPAFQKSKLVSPRRKVDPRIASYTCVPKSSSFVKLHYVENFSTLIIFSLKVI